MSDSSVTAVLERPIVGNGDINAYLVAGDGTTAIAADIEEVPRFVREALGY